MVTKTATPVPAVGDEVCVYWGLEEVPGLVIDVYGSGPLARAMVRVPILGSNGEELGSEDFSLPFSALRPRSDASSEATDF